MARLTGFTRNPDPISCEDLAAHIGTTISKTITYVEVSPTEATVDGSTISESDRSAIQAAIDSYAYVAPVPPGVPRLEGGRVTVSQLGTGTGDGTKFLRDDRTWATPGGGSGSTNFLISIYNDASVNITFTNLPLLGVEVTSPRFRYYADLTGCARFRVGGVLVTASAVAAKIKLQYSTDNGTNWADLKDTSETNDPDMPLSGATGARKGVFGNIVAAAKTDVLLRAFAYNGDGIVDPVISNLYAQFK